MLSITVPETKLWDERNEEFIDVKEQTLMLEHSLISIYDWESKWHKPFMHTKEKTIEETLDYIRCMTVTKNVKPEVYECLTEEIISEIEKYINDSMTATTFSDLSSSRPNNDVITSELIYYWMITNGVPVEFQKWHINRLLTLLRVCAIKNTPPKKMKQGELISRYAAINEARKKRHNTRG